METPEERIDRHFAVTRYLLDNPEILGMLPDGVVLDTDRPVILRDTTPITIWDNAIDGKKT